jgi:hypothetical protein
MRRSMPGNGMHTSGVEKINALELLRAQRAGRTRDGPARSSKPNFKTSSAPPCHLRCSSSHPHLHLVVAPYAPNYSQGGTLDTRLRRVSTTIRLSVPPKW